MCRAALIRIARISVVPTVYTLTYCDNERRKGGQHKTSEREGNMPGCMEQEELKEQEEQKEEGEQEQEELEHVRLQGGVTGTW